MHFSSDVMASSNGETAWSPKPVGTGTGSAVFLEFLQESFPLGIQLFHLLEVVFRDESPRIHLDRVQESQLATDLANSCFDRVSALCVHGYPFAIPRVATLKPAWPAGVERCLTATPGLTLLSSCQAMDFSDHCLLFGAGMFRSYITSLRHQDCVYDWRSPYFVTNFSAKIARSHSKSSSQLLFWE